MAEQDYIIRHGPTLWIIPGGLIGAFLIIKWHNWRWDRKEKKRQHHG